MSTSALWASSVSCTSCGTAWALICRSRPFSVGYSTTSTSVMTPSATVTCTCTGPQRVSTDGPVTVTAPLVSVVLPVVPPSVVLPTGAACTTVRAGGADDVDVDV